MRLTFFRISCCIFCFYLVSVKTPAQGVMIGNNPADRLLIMKKAAVPKTDFSDIQGTMYDRDSFILGVVVTDKDSFYNIPLKYNIYEDVVEFQLRDQTHILEPTGNIKKILIDRQTLVIQPYKFGDKIKAGFFIELSAGKVRLLLRKTTRFQDMQLATAMKYKNTPARFVAEPDQYYMRIGNDPAVEIKKLKKAIELFPDHKKSVQSYAERRKLSVKEKDLTALWTYYNSLD